MYLYKTQLKVRVQPPVLACVTLERFNPIHHACTLWLSLISSRVLTPISLPGAA